MKQKNAYPLRLDDTLQQKLKQLAKDNDRTYRAQIENILKNYVAEYEKENGEIVVNL
ncbi:MAG: hypothetical protein LUE24_13365 [Lachnospiraceae bacterium]|nr:hypothetical protein [Lachnospiraceae bacterium]